tara:strand:+ start:79 stop:417 length:339 start_codon:yes stop_codon:yes gene_type:complete
MAFQNIIGNVLIPATAVTGAFVTLYTTPASTRTFLKCIDICNTTGGALTIFISLVAALGTAGTANALYSGYTIAANTTLSWRGLQVLPAGTFISVKSTTTGLTITASGGEAT